MIEFANRKFLLTDTVGFIDRLPISLIEAFHSTLEETIFADLIVLVVDFSEPLQTIETKNNVSASKPLTSSGASGIPMVTALNKIDLIKPEEREEKLEALKDKVKNPIMLSAKCETNLEELKKTCSACPGKFSGSPIQRTPHRQCDAVYFLDAPES